MIDNSKEKKKGDGKRLKASTGSTIGLLWGVKMTKNNREHLDFADVITELPNGENAVFEMIILRKLEEEQQKDDWKFESERGIKK